MIDEQKQCVPSFRRVTGSVAQSSKCATTRQNMHTQLPTTWQRPYHKNTQTNTKQRKERHTGSSASVSVSPAQGCAGFVEMLFTFATLEPLPLPLPTPPPTAVCNSACVVEDRDLNDVALPEASPGPAPSTNTRLGLVNIIPPALSCSSSEVSPI